MPPPKPEDEKQDPEPFRPVVELFCQAVGDWMVDSLAVYQSARGQGVGALLLDDAFDKAANAGTQRVSLVAEDSNDQALKLYRSRGMKVWEKRPFISFGTPSPTKNWLLLSASLT